MQFQSKPQFFFWGVGETRQLNYQISSRIYEWEYPIQILRIKLWQVLYCIAYYTMLATV